MEFYKFASDDVKILLICLEKKLQGEKLPREVAEGKLYGDDAIFPEFDGSQRHKIILTKSYNKGKIRTSRKARDGFWKVNTTKNKITTSIRGREYIYSMRSLTFKSRSSATTTRNLNMDEYELEGIENPEGWVICRVKQGHNPSRRRDRRRKASTYMNASPRHQMKVSDDISVTDMTIGDEMSVFNTNLADQDYQGMLTEDEMNYLRVGLNTDLVNMTPQQQPNSIHAAADDWNGLNIDYNDGTDVDTLFQELQNNQLYDINETCRLWDELQYNY